jgi:hypothetical protein
VLIVYNRRSTVCRWHFKNNTIAKRLASWGLTGDVTGDVTDGVTDGVTEVIIGGLTRVVIGNVKEAVTEGVTGGDHRRCTRAGE